MNLAESITKSSKLALTRAKLRSMHSELSYGLSFAPKLQLVGSIHISGSDQPTPDPSFSLLAANAEDAESLISRAVFSLPGGAPDWRSQNLTQAESCIQYDSQSACKYK